VEISQKDSTTKEITMLVHKLDLVNGNGLDFKEEYASQYIDTILNKPVVTKYHPLKDDLGDHEPVYDSNGKITELRTIAIGTIKEAWIDDYQIDSSNMVRALFAKAIVWSYKYPQIVNCIENLFNDNSSTSSVEVEIYKYGENPSQEYRYPTEYAYLGNCLLGSTVTPADSDAGVISVFQKEIAMAVKHDLEMNENSEGGEQMDKNAELFNKGYEIRDFLNIEVSSLTFDQISSQIYNSLNPIDPKSLSRDYNYYINEIYNDHVIVEDWNDYKTLYKISYSIVNESVVLEAKDSWVRGYKGFIPDGVVISSLLAENETLSAELNNKTTELNNQYKEEKLVTEEQIKELQSKVDELSIKVVDLEGTIVAQQETIQDHVSKEAELASEIEGLTPFKVKYETAEKESEKAKLVEKFSKLLPEDVMKSEVIVSALEELNVSALNSAVVEQATKEIATKQSNTQTDEPVVVVASKHEDLIEENVLQKYGIN
jgi:hypothetical protein